MSRSTGMLWPVALFGLLLTGSVHAGLAIITHPDNPEPALTLNQVKRIYLAKARTFPQGGTVRRADQAPDTPAYREFVSKVLGLREQQLNAYWSKMTFTGRGVRPDNVGDDADVRQWILQHRDGLGYIDTGQVNEQVKVLLIVP